MGEASSVSSVCPGNRTVTEHTASTGESLTVRAPAKINLFLEVLGKRPDGYHEIRTVVQAVDLCDVLRFRVRDDGQVRVHCQAVGVPPGEENLVFRAARALKERCGVEKGVDVWLEKRIPVGGGLGGGSSDCAAALQALVHLWELDVPGEDLHGIAARLGSDVPFFLRGGAALCEGRGEKVSPVQCAATFDYVLVMPPLMVSTAKVYGRVENALTASPEALTNVVAGLRTGDLRRLRSGLYNALQRPAFEACAQLGDIRERLEALCSGRGAGGLMCGSGSSFFSLHEGRTQARGRARVLARELALPCVAVRSLPAWDWCRSKVL